MSADPAERSFLRRVVIVVAVVGVAIVLAQLVLHASHVLLLLFAGVLFGVLLGGLAQKLSEWVPLGYRASLAVVALVLTGVLVGLGFLLGPSVASQMGQLGTSLNDALGQLRTWLAGTSWGDGLAQALPHTASEAASQAAEQAASGSDGAAAASGGGSPLMDYLTGFFSSAVDVLTAVVVIVFTGAYLAANPKLYTEALVKLIAHSKRERAREVFEALGLALRRWLMGQFFAMLLVGVLATVGLVLLDVPLALTIGLLTFLLVFIPYVGAFASAALAILIALLDSPQTAVYVAALYGGVQFLESYFITPLVQERVVSIPPVLLLGSQFLLGVLAGGLGIALATPLAVVVVVLVQMLYVEDVLGDDVDVIGTKGRF